MIRIGCTSIVCVLTALACSSSPSAAGTSTNGGTTANGGTSAGGSNAGGAVGGATGGASVSTGGAATSTGGAATSTGGAATSTGGAATSTGGAATSTGGAAVSTGGAATSTGGAATSTGGAATSTGGAATSSDAGAGTPLTDVYITWYGFNDNSCQVESHHDCNTIAFPKSDGWPVPHDIATEGAGTYADPNTFATAANDDGSNAEIPVGALIYIPEVRKYFVMEDQCFECGQEWTANMSHHVDLWMGPSFGSDDAALTSCEDKLTIGSANRGTGTIIVNPPPNLPVDTTPLFQNNTCTAKTYSN
jgi:hypothetical protein